MGKGATGILIQIAQSKGYDNVADYLKALQTKKGTDEFDEEEDGEVVEGDDEGDAQADAKEKPKKKKKGKRKRRLRPSTRWKAWSPSATQRKARWNTWSSGRDTTSLTIPGSRLRAWNPRKSLSISLKGELHCIH